VPFPSTYAVLTRYRRAILIGGAATPDAESFLSSAANLLAVLLAPASNGCSSSHHSFFDCAAQINVFEINGMTVLQHL
jgi:hypothetical protein